MSAQAAERYDILIRGGTVIDGTGKPGTRADVGVRGDRIVFVGDAGAAQATRVIEAKGLTVTPGFIDAHNHVPDYFLEMRARGGPAASDRSPILNEGDLVQGVTTLVGGPDGFLSPKSIQAAIDEFSARGIATNYAFYVGHNGVRSEVMGSAHGAPSAEELARMKQLVREGMQMGAVGLSSGLMYEPGMFSDTAEVIALAREVKPFDGIYDSHVRDPVFKLLASDEECLRIGREAGIPAKIGHEKAVGLINAGRIDSVIAMVEKARAAGEGAVTDQYPYDGAATAALSQVIVVPGMPDAFSQAPDVTLPKIQAALRDPSQKTKIQAATEHGIDGGFSWVKAVGYGSMRIVDSKDFPELIGRNIELLAKERNQSPYELLVGLILSSRTPTLMTLGSIEEQDVRKLLVQPWNMIASDGSYVTREVTSFEHPRSAGTFTRVLGHYARDEKVLTLPDAVRKMTSLPADFLRLSDRGRIEAGKAADIAVFDAATVRDNSTWARPGALSTGVRYVVVSGALALDNGTATGATPGRFIKRQVRAAR